MDTGSGNEPVDGVCTEPAQGQQSESLWAQEDETMDPVLDKLRGWHYTNGGILHGLHLSQSSPYEYEFTAATDIKAETMVTFIPDTLLMTAEDALNDSPTCKTIQEKGLLPKLKSQVLVPLAIHFMEHRRDPESPWADYFATINPDLSNHLLFWTEEELEWLKGSEIIGYRKQQRQKISADYRLLAENIDGFSEQFPEQEFEESYKIVQSKIFAVADDDG